MMAVASLFNKEETERVVFVNWSVRFLTAGGGLAENSQKHVLTAHVK